MDIYSVRDDIGSHYGIIGWKFDELLIKEKYCLKGSGICMIGYLKGAMIECVDDTLVLEVNSIGYEVKVHSRFVESMQIKEGILFVYTYTYVREDAIALYGFSTKTELRLFKMLITVNGIGPKGALAILSVLSVETLCTLIQQKDAKGIAKAPGIGLKTAERLILDLKDKLGVLEYEGMSLSTVAGANQVEQSFDSVMQDALDALTALGYSYSQARDGIRKVDKESYSDVNGLLKEAFKNLI